MVKIKGEYVLFFNLIKDKSKEMNKKKMKEAP